MKKTVSILLGVLLLLGGLTGCGRGAAEAGAESEAAETLPAEKTELSVPSGGESADPAAYGAAFAALKQRVGDWALLNRSDCLIWQEQGEDAGRETWAAVSENGVTVTGLLRYTLQEDGTPLCLPEGLEPIAPVEDPTVFLELSPDALAERLGPCHFNMDLGGVSVPCWFTEDGKLLVLRVLEQVEDAGLRELCVEALPGEESLSEADAITVHLEQIPTQISAPARWERFLAACERGEPDRVKLHLSCAEGAFDLLLDYDGSLYRMTDESGTRTYQHLIVSREDEPPANAAFRHAVHYLLSDDADMTHQRWFSCMVSSAMIPDFPPTAAIFTVYEP